MTRYRMCFCLGLLCCAVAGPLVAAALFVAGLPLLGIGAAGATGALMAELWSWVLAKGSAR